MCEILLKLISDNVFLAGAIGTAWSWLIEFAPLLDGLEKARKRLAVLALSISIPMAALILGAYVFSCEMAVNAESVMTAFIAGVLAFTASQIAHLYLGPSESRFVHRK